MLQTKVPSLLSTGKPNTDIGKGQGVKCICMLYGLTSNCYMFFLPMHICFWFRNFHEKNNSKKTRYSKSKLMRFSVIHTQPVVDELEFYFFFLRLLLGVKVVWIISASDPNFENMENGLDIHVELWIQIIQIHLHMDEHKILHCKNPTKMVCSIIGSGISKYYKRIFLLYTMTQFVLAYGRF